MSSLRPRVTDTPPAVAQLYQRLLLARSGADRLKMGCEMFDATRALALAGLSRGNDLATAADLKVELFLRTYSAELDPVMVARIVERLKEVQPAASLSDLFRT